MGNEIRSKRGLEVDKEGVAIDKLEGFKFYVLDGLGQIEKVYE